jgi:rubrerythrin
MATRKLRKHEDPKQHWVCEDCERPHVQPNPPDACEGCGHVYFDNLFDMLMRSGAQTNHAA